MTHDIYIVKTRTNKHKQIMYYMYFMSMMVVALGITVIQKSVINNK